MSASSSIRAVVFDLGGTLEEVFYDDAIRLEAAGGLHEMLVRAGLDPGFSLESLHAAVLSGMAGYQEWRERTEQELPPETVWTEYILPQSALPRDRLREVAEELTFYFEDNYFVRTLRPEAPEVLASLREQGLRLALISNIVSSSLVPHRLALYGIDGFFDPVLTSSGFGYRKPHPSIFLEATQVMELPPSTCAYVGDTVSRDVAGARRAGYGLAVQIRSFLTDRSDRDGEGPRPDVVIRDLRDLAGVLADPPTRRPA